jgi:hypothetical protein
VVEFVEKNKRKKDEILIEKKDETNVIKMKIHM